MKALLTESAVVMIMVMGLFLWYQVAALSSPFGSTTKNVATQVVQGAGPSVVDLNQYNLQSLDEIVNEWKVNLMQAVNSRDVTARLDCQSPSYFVDTVRVEYPRNDDDARLGLVLAQVAGGREDDLGLTLVSDVLQGTAAAACDILPGDALTQVGLLRRKRQQQGHGTDGPQQTQDVVEDIQVRTECLSYDATVEQIGRLPAPDKNYEDRLTLTLKRIRRKPIVRVHLKYPPSQQEEDVTLELFAGENLRQGMLVRGVKLNDPLAKRFDTKNGGNCGAGGLCRTCSVSMQHGADLLNPQKPAEKQMLADSPRWRLACKAIVGFGMMEGDMTVRVNPRQW